MDNDEKLDLSLNTLNLIDLNQYTEGEKNELLQDWIISKIKTQMII